MASKNETLGQTKQRHKLELRTLQNDVKAFQKKAKKDRLSKKDMEAQVLAMESALKERHDQEIKAFENETDEQGDTPTTQPDAASAEPETTAPSKQAKAQAKAQRKREAKKKQERERRERIEEANKNTVSERQIEADMIQAQLSRHGLTIKDIPSDGHCMYHAVADQMKQKNMPIVDEVTGFQYLRKLTSEYMLAHPDDFLPFMALDDAAEGLEDAFVSYCDRVANTADWGGQLELRALACALRTPIEVFSAEGDVLVMGSEFVNEDDESAPKLQLTYHLHYYTLGEHFNSVTAASN
ncbi:OTU ovarian tumor-like cysteine protease [Phytophthora palmivora]|uniref:OTU ovarian tumor-like cysteine protease n=1 Tax=Phytophthora palmivora TaxID=4796 RepID=A0A2P4YQ59_9STRA|nr:OTU ovarian tumor-like cysteine protease [Phytophthora palmivora]